MKKLLMIMMVVFCLVLTLGSTSVNAQSFNYDEAYQILQGKWIDTEKNKEVTLVWKSKDGSECNIVNKKGYTDPTGNSRIYFDYKGAQMRVDVTYYPDQNRYYAEMDKFNPNMNDWFPIYFSLMKL